MTSRESCRSPFRVVPNISTPAAADGNTKWGSSHDFAEQIKQLEQEGNKLLESTHHLGDTLLGYNSDAGAQGTNRASLTALADISAEQRTINQLRVQLDEQTRDADRLSRQFLEDRPPYRSATYGTQPVVGSNLARLEIPGTSDTVSSYVSQSQLERQLREANAQVTDLRDKLREALEVSEQQKEHFRSSVEELKSQLQEAVLTRDRALDTSTQDATIRRLQANVEQLQQTNSLQEETMAQLNLKLEGLQKEHYAVDTVMNQVRSLLLDREHRRGRPFYESEPVTRQGTTMLIHTLERCLQEMDAEVDLRQGKLHKVSMELEEEKLRSEEKENLLLLEHEDRLVQLREEQQRQLSSLQESSGTAKKQAGALQEQISMLQHQADQQQRLKEDGVRHLEGKIQQLTDDIVDERRVWRDKRDALELAVDESVRELAVVKAERDEAIRNAAAIESRFRDMQHNIERLQLELSAEQEQCRHLRERESTLRNKESELAEEVRVKSEVLARLERSLEQVKQDANAQLQQTLTALDKESKEHAAREINKLATQLNAVTEQCHKRALDLEVTKSEYRNLQERYTEKKELHENVQSQLQCELSKKEHLNEMLKERMAEMEKVTRDRDHYRGLADEKSTEVISLRSLRDKLTVQLEEREKNFLSVQDQNEKMFQMSDANTQAALSLKEERDDLVQRLNEKIVETEDMRRGGDSLVKKLKMQDKHLAELEEDNVKLAEELKAAKVDIDGMVKEKDSLFTELRQSRYEVCNIRDDKEELERRLSDQEVALSGETRRLTDRLKATEHDLKLARRALRTVEEVDGRAVKVAGKMQKQVTAKRGEIDSLQSKMRWLEECLDAALKEKKLLQDENDKLTSTARRGVQQNDRLTAELRNYKGQNQELKEKASELKAELERASVKYGSSQALSEKHEQDVARLQLQHQLQLKELERTGRIKKGASLTDAKPPGSPKRSRASTIASRSRLTTSNRSKSVDQEMPVRQKPSKADVEAFAAENGVGSELKKLLEDMRALVYSYPNRLQQTISYDAEPESSEQESLSRPKSSSSSRKGRKGSRSSRHKDKTPGRDRAESPVSELLSSVLVGTYGELSDVSYSDTDSPDFSPVRRHQSKGAWRLGADTQVLCKRLEKRIENLSKMGGHLQQENKEMAKLMKDQDKRMKKVKTQVAR